ncbi:hypothetical protein CR205_08590 [Alteribacter lacisalsi]|uniref:Uncharacterized protein n=1 Tax=Alteribacter lacisalsi TaxID=2045244 RepID=A0A2W0HNF8_9BACI|nr:hypothetical protein [Alteribacter lacisalsi]PYZ98622.1 hypothetical protein CR205_08590 [Alteribacter lacisalsi]
MLEFFTLVFFMLLAGIAVGSLLMAKMIFSWHIVLTVTGLVYFFCVWTGMLMGSWLWFPDPLLKGLISLIAVVMAVFFFRTYHPSTGYIPAHGLYHWGAFAMFFFFLGFESGIAGVSMWFILLYTLVFSGGILASAWIMWKLKNASEFRFLTQYVPILLFVFIAVLKLV